MLIAIMSEDSKWFNSKIQEKAKVFDYGHYVGKDDPLESFEDDFWWEMDKAAYLGEDAIIVGIQPDTLEHFGDRANVVFVPSDFEGDRFGAIDLPASETNQDIASVLVLIEAANRTWGRDEENV